MNLWYTCKSWILPQKLVEKGTAYHMNKEHNEQLSQGYSMTPGLSGG